MKAVVIVFDTPIDAAGYYSDPVRVLIIVYPLIVIDIFGFEF